jgi:hypothetical protein
VVVLLVCCFCLSSTVGTFFFTNNLDKRSLEALYCGKSLLREACIVVLHLLLRFRLAWVDVQAIALTILIEEK